jgi:replication fork clamp-binding protein CrfC
MARKVILRFDDDITYEVETDFSSDEILEVAEIIQEELSDTDDGWNEEKIVQELQKRDYIKIVGPGPEVYDILVF